MPIGCSLGRRDEPDNTEQTNLAGEADVPVISPYEIDFLRRLSASKPEYKSTDSG